MSDSFKYFTASEEDKEWGVTLNAVGFANIEKDTFYPPGGHPSGYTFGWEKGRILDEYQINYITEGEGIFENKHGKYKIKPGTLIILHPGEWHRYKPLKKTGWKEHYIGFKGELADKLLNSEHFNKKVPLIKVEFRKELINQFFRILENSFPEKSGYQHINSGMIVTYLGLIMSFIKNKDFEGKEIERLIQQSCLILREKITENINAQELASQLNMGYSYFRTMFKKYTGMSPIQYHLQLKIKRAEDLILTNQKPIKEIAYDLGFQSVYYFSRLFKKKNGQSPSEYRRTYTA